MFWTITCRVMVSVVAFFVGWAAFVLVRPAPAQNAIAPKPLAHSHVTSITLKRLGCVDAELECPVFDVTFRNDGTATFVARANNEDFKGTYTAEYPLEDFAYLVQQLDRERFFELPLVYPAAPVEDTWVLEVTTTDGARVLTTNNWSSTPAELRALEALIERQSFNVVWDEQEK